MIYINDSPQDYKLKIQFAPGSSVALTGTAPRTWYQYGRLLITYGVPYLAGYHGFEVLIKETDDGTVTESQLTITTPGGSYDSGVISGLEPYAVWVYIEGAVLTTNCNVWEFSADLVGFYADEERTEPLLELLNVSDSGTGFDKRQAVPEWATWCDTDPGFAYPPLPSDSCDVSGSAHLSPTITGGWMIWDGSVWQPKELLRSEEDVPEPLPPGSCPAVSAELPVITILSDSSWDFNLAAEIDLEYDHQATYTRECYCIKKWVDEDGHHEQNCGSPRIYTGHDLVVSMLQSDSRLKPAPSDFGLPTRNMEATAWATCCTLPDDADRNYSSVTARTYVSLTRQVVYTEQLSFCIETFVPGLCCTVDATDPEGTIVDPNPNCYHSDEYCSAYAAQSLVTWEPSCLEETSKDLDVVCSETGRCWWAWIELAPEPEHNQLYVARSLGHLVEGYEVESAVVAGSVSHPCVAYHPSGYVEVVYTYLASMYGSMSYDAGITWTDPEEKMEGIFGRLVYNSRGDGMRAVVREVDTDEYRLYTQYRGSGDTDWRDEILVSTSDGPFEVEKDSFGLEYDPSTGAWMIFALANGATERVVLISMDRGQTWKQ